MEIARLTKSWCLFLSYRFIQDKLFFFMFTEANIRQKLSQFCLVYDRFYICSGFWKTYFFLAHFRTYVYMFTCKIFMVRIEFSLWFQATFVLSFDYILYSFVGKNVSIYSQTVNIRQQVALKYVKKRRWEKLRDDLLRLTYVMETHTGAPVAR